MSWYSKSKHKKHRFEPCFTDREGTEFVVLNIAEGSADNSDIEFARFLGISIRSVYEVVAGFDLALLYDMITPEQGDKIEADAHELVKQLSGFRNSLKAS